MKFQAKDIVQNVKLNVKTVSTMLITVLIVLTVEILKLHNVNVHMVITKLMKKNAFNAVTNASLVKMLTTIV